MFVERISTEVITIEEEIKVVGLSLEKYGYPKQAGKIPEMWHVFKDKHSGKVKNIIDPDIGYWFWFMVPGNYDYVVGNAVTDFEDIDDELTTCAIPAGRYIKDSFNAKDFGDLVDGILQRRKEDVKKWAEENNVKIAYESVTAIEVYPEQEITSQYPSMYTLTPIE